MSFTASITQGDIIRGLGGFLTNVLPSGTSVYQGQANRTASPKGNFVTMTLMGRGRLATNEDDWDVSAENPTVMTCKMSTEFDIRLDVHGPLSSDYAGIIDQLARDPYPSQWFADNDLDMRILYSDDPKQVPFMTAESQYEDRYIMTMSMQANVVLDIPIQTANQLKVNLIYGDTAYAYFVFVGDNELILNFVGSNMEGLRFRAVDSHIVV